MGFRTLGICALLTLSIGCQKTAKNINATDPSGEFKNVFGEDNRTKAPDDSPYSKIVKIYTPSSGCTGSLVGKNLVLTNAHCVDECITPDGQISCDINVYAGLKKSKYKAKAKAVRVAYGTLEPEKFIENDWALIMIDSDLGNTFGYLGCIGELPLESGYNFDLTLAGYGMDFEGGDVKFYHQGCQIKHHDLRGFVLHDCDMVRGSSGSPIFKNVDNQGYLIVALNAAEYRGGSESLTLKEYSAANANVAVKPKDFCKWIGDWRQAP